MGTIYKYEDKYYYYDDDTGIIYQGASGFPIEKNSYAGKKLYEELTSSGNIVHDNVPTKTIGVAYLENFTSDNIYDARDGKAYLKFSKGSTHKFDYTLGTNTYHITLPGEFNIHFWQSSQKEIVRKTISAQRRLTDDELLNVLKEFDSSFQPEKGSTDFEKLKGWYVQLLDNNDTQFGFDSIGPLDIDSKGKVTYLTNEDGSRVTFEDAANQEATYSNQQDRAYDKYFSDIYNYKEDGTRGKQFYDELVAGERAAGQSAINLANAQTQQLGMQQAAYVKNVTDQLRSERMARLRAGMSESQIASQDMQQLYANMNSLNDQIVASNMNALQGQEQINNAQYTAFQNWLNSANQMAQAGSAYSAAQAGDINAQAIQYLHNQGIYNWTADDYARAVNAVGSGQKQASSVYNEGGK